MSSNRWNRPTAVHPGACTRRKQASPGLRPHLANKSPENGIAQTRVCSLVYSVYSKLSARTAAPSAEARSGSESTASWMRAGKSCRQATATLGGCSVICQQRTPVWCGTMYLVLRAVVARQHVSLPMPHAHDALIHISMHPHANTHAPTSNDPRYAGAITWVSNSMSTSLAPQFTTSFFQIGFTFTATVNPQLFTGSLGWLLQM